MLTYGKKRFRRPCRRCNNYFRPTGIDCRICPKCVMKHYKLRFKIKYQIPFKGKRFS